MPVVKEISWANVFARLAPIDQPGARVYGVPRGGMLVSGFLKRATNVHCPEEATVIIDDIEDSGKTKRDFLCRFPSLPFVPLFTPADKPNGEWLHFPWEPAPNADAEELVVRLLEYIGEDPNREGLKATPGRVVRSWGTLYGGYRQKPEEILATCFAADTYDEMVVLKDIEFYSMCEHHMLPFSGRAHVAYIPDKQVVGISKLARLVDCFARRLQIQERMTVQIAQAIETTLKPVGVGVAISAAHLCMRCRGVQKQNSEMLTSCLLGRFRENESTRSEFFSLIRGDGL